MMSNYAVVKNSVVVNVIVWNGTNEIDIPKGIQLVKIGDGEIGSIGMSWGDDRFTSSDPQKGDD